VYAKAKPQVAVSPYFTYRRRKPCGGWHSSSEV